MDIMHISNHLIQFGSLEGDCRKKERKEEKKTVFKSFDLYVWVMWKEIDCYILQQKELYSHQLFDKVKLIYF